MKTKIRGHLKDLGWTLAMAFGLYSTVMFIVDFADPRRRELRIEFDAPWPIVADALMVLFWCSLFGVWRELGTCPRPDLLELSWLWIGTLAVAMRFAWEWRWGFTCHPRRTRFGQWLDSCLATLENRFYNRGRRGGR